MAVSGNRETDYDSDGRVLTRAVELSIGGLHIWEEEIKK